MIRAQDYSFGPKIQNHNFIKCLHIDTFYLPLDLNLIDTLKWKTTVEYRLVFILLAQLKKNCFVSQLFRSDTFYANEQQNMTAKKKKSGKSANKNPSRFTSI